MAVGVPLSLLAQIPQFPVPVTINPDQSITYNPTSKGDRIPDFSTVGYNYGNSPLPDEPGGYQVPVLVTLEPGTGDQTDRIQAAIDFISAKPLVNGFRGALLLKAGLWEIHSANRIAIRASGVVLKGEGDNPLTGTRLYARGTTNENDSGNTRNSRLIAFAGNGNTVNTTARTLVDAVYVPGGVNVIPITGHAFTVGQRIQVRLPGTVAWQKASFYNTAATADTDAAVTFNRIITAVTANSITLDAPITSPLDPFYANAYIVPVTAFNNITNVGVSNIYFESVESGDTDENHVWNALDFTNVEDGFVHNCTARYFAYSIAYVNTSTRKITINRSQCYDGISIIKGGRRYHFVLTGEMGLVSNALSRYGRHSFIINWPAAPGPNAFVDSTSFQSYNESGSHADWNNGGLWDNVSELAPSGVGLQVKLERPSAYCVAWNVVTPNITFENMPLSPNWSFGTTTPSGGTPTWRNSTGQSASLLGKAEVWSNGTKMSVRSLYEKQVETRLAAAGSAYRYQANPPTRIAFPPVIRTPSQLVALSGSAFSYQLPVSNIVAATSSPNYQVTGLPVGLTRNATTGLISGTLPTVSVETNYTLSVSARNVDGTTTKAMTLTVRPAGSPKIPLTLSVGVDMDRTTPLLIGGTNSATAIPVPMVPASRLLAPMIVRKSYTSDINGAAYTTADVPVPVRGALSLEGLTSPLTITYNGSTTLPTAPGYYDVVATLDDPIYSATATGRLLITNAAAVTVTLGNTTAPTAVSPVTATSPQPSITPVITYDGSTTFPDATGHYAAEAIVADSDYFGSRLTLIGIPPKITQQPVSLTVNPGTSATFSVTATGTPNTYQWRKDTVAIPGATMASYTIPSVQLADEASYDVVITHPAGVTTSAVATLTVLRQPQITQQPATQNVGLNASATLTVTATGGSLTYQWRKSGAPISEATAATYTLPSVQVADSGAYDVVITNPLGNITSSAAILTVVSPPQITVQPASLTINQGTSATFSVAATGLGNTFQWRKTGAAIPGATGASFTVFPAFSSDAGSYDVVVTNIAGTTTATAATLTVIVAPQITQQPAAQTLTQGSSLTFTIAATGLSNTYQWRKAGAPIPGATATSYSIGSLQSGDAGSYDVLVTNPAGGVVSSPATLIVIAPPQITQPPASRTAGLGLPVTFSVTATGLSNTYQWRKAGTPISGATATSYTLTSVQAGDAASYDVVVTNPAGSATSAPATLTLASSGVLQKANNTTALDQSGSWTGSVVPGPYDTSLWTGAYTNGTVAIGAGLSVGRIQHSATTAITLNAGTGPLTLADGGIEITSTATQNLTVNAPVVLAADQTWTVANGRTLTVTGALGQTNGTRFLSLAGPGTTTLSGINTLTGGLIIAPPDGGLPTYKFGGNNPSSIARLTGGAFPAPITANGRLDITAPITSLGTISGTGATGLIWNSSTTSQNLTFAGGSSFSMFQVGADNARAVLRQSGTGGVTFSFFGYNTAAPNSAHTFDGGAWTLGQIGQNNSGAQASGTYTLTNAADVTISTNGTFAHGTWRVLNGSLRFASAISVLHGSATGTNTSLVLQVDNSGGGPGLLTATGGLTLADGGSMTNANSLTIGTGGTVILAGGLTLGSTTARTAETDTVNLTGGELSLSGTLAAAAATTGQTRTFNWTGGQLTAAVITPSAGFATPASGGVTPTGLNQTAGILAPGDIAIPGRTTNNGNYTLANPGILALDLGGTTAATVFQGTASQFDNLVVTGTTSLGGQLSVSLGNSFIPANSATFTILTSTGTLTGAFANAPFGSRLITSGAEGSFLVSQIGNTVTLSDYASLTPLESWRQAALGSIANTGTAANAADPDRDGLPNLLEYALGTSPTSASATSAPSISLLPAPASKLQLSFLRARSDLTYTVEASSDLFNWAVIATNPGTVSSSVPVTVADTVTPAPRRFLRLRVSNP